MAIRPMLVVALLALGACGKSELYSGLTEIQANEMVAILRNAGIDAEKQPGEEGRYLIAAPAESFGQAIRLLRAEGYPRDEFESLGTVFRKEGFVSSPLEERARLVYGLSQELSHTVSQIDGVVQARVHLALPEADPMNGPAKPASASVFIKYRPGIDLERQVAQIKSLVVNAVEGLQYDKVTVALFPAQPLPAPRAVGFGEQVVASAGPIVAAGALGLGLVASWPILRRRLARPSRREPAP
jgi:type III secretion protein J